MASVELFEFNPERRGVPGHAVDQPFVSQSKGRTLLVSTDVRSGVVSRQSEGEIPQLVRRQIFTFRRDLLEQ